MVTTNPPYMVGSHGLTGENQAKVIARHETLCNLEDIVSQAAKVLKPRGRFYMVHRPFRLAEIFSVMVQYGIELSACGWYTPMWTKSPTWCWWSNIDVITLHQAGFDNVVATMGTALTEEHARILARYTKELVLCYDNDAAGKQSTDRVLNILKNANLNVRVLQLPNAYDAEGKPIKQDPDDFVKKFGPAAFEKCLNGSAGQNDYRLETLQQKHSLADERAAWPFSRRR